MRKTNKYEGKMASYGFSSADFKSISTGSCVPEMLLIIILIAGLNVINSEAPGSSESLCNSSYLYSDTSPLKWTPLLPATFKVGKSLTSIESKQIFKRSFKGFGSDAFNASLAAFLAFVAAWFAAAKSLDKALNCCSDSALSFFDKIRIRQQAAMATTKNIPATNPKAASSRSFGV